MDGEDLKTLQQWNDIELEPCFQIPDIASQSQLYADKSCSISKSELAEHLLSNKKQIPSNRLLIAALETGDFKNKVFIEKVYKNGIQEEHLIIALHPKECKLKIKGRYFTYYLRV